MNFKLAWLAACVGLLAIGVVASVAHEHCSRSLSGFECMQCCRKRPGKTDSDWLRFHFQLCRCVTDKNAPIKHY